MIHQALGVLASGRGSNLEALLDARSRGKLSIPIVVVVSDVPDAGALAIARRAGVEALALDAGPKPARLSGDAEQTWIEALRSRGVDLIALAGFMRIIGRPFLDAFPNAVLNIHPSLLPSFPGLHAQAQAHQWGVKVSGCTAHFVTEGIDAGPIVEQAVVPLRDDDTPESLAARILVEEHRIFPRAVDRVARGEVRIVGRRTVATSRSTSGEVT